MPKLTYTNEFGESIVFSNRPPFILSNIEGLGDVDADVQTQKSPFQDGETQLDTNLDPRYIAMEVSIVEKNIDEYRRYLSSIMNPKFNGILRYEDDLIIREIVCVNEHVPIFTNKTKSSHKVKVSLVCPNPYWQDAMDSIDEMAVFVGKFEFPLEIPHDTGMEFGDQGEIITIENPGDAETPVVIEFNGPAVNPKVTNLTTGEYILVNRTIAEEQKLIIDTEFGVKKVEIHDENGLVENAFHWIDLGSSFWQLQQNDNEIEYEADVGMNDARVIITRKNRYVGV